ncbi:hypothetical protein [Streptomyces sp. NPDC060366]|uniref:hypothetical protein n=1 Tax=Streptomyces sp. NPDC060366 TaxID=3347105 RepID=UPI00364A0A9A
MTTPTRPRTLRARLLAYVSDATGRLTAAWKILTRARDTLIGTLAGIRPGRAASARIRAAGMAFQQQLADFDRNMLAWIERWAATDLPLLYREGALAMLDRADRPHNAWSWTALHQAAITALSAQYYADLMGRLREALRRARAFLRAALDAARVRHSRFETAVFDRDALRRDHPLDTVIYANSARHPVDSWARSAVSWQAVTSANAGAARTAWEQLGVTQVKVVDGSGCGWRNHSDPDRADGSLRDIEDALTHPVAHANCVREFLPHFPRPATFPGALA